MTKLLRQNISHLTKLRSKFMKNLCGENNVAYKRQRIQKLRNKFMKIPCGENNVAYKRQRIQKLRNKFMKNPLWGK